MTKVVWERPTFSPLTFGCFGFALSEPHARIFPLMDRDVVNTQKFGVALKRSEVVENVYVIHIVAAQFFLSYVQYFWENHFRGRIILAIKQEKCAE